MKQGIIFTKDKKEIDVFFLKAEIPPELDWQLGHQIGDGSKENPIIVDEESGKALMEDMQDCCHDLHLLSEQDVNENSAGEGAHGCAVGQHEGVTGWKGYHSLYDAILDAVRNFEHSQLNISSETAQEILAMSIERKVNDYYDKK